VLLTVFYCLILAPFGLGVRLFADPLRLRRQHHSHWLGKERQTTTSWEQARRQF
jgi:hypothetical protein